MAYQHDRFCPTNQYDPEPPGWCDRCSRKFFLRDLDWQFQQVGPGLKNLRLKVCPACMDDPATFLAPIRAIGPEGVVRFPAPFIISPSLYGTGPSMPVGSNLVPDEPIEGYADLGDPNLLTDGGVPLRDDTGGEWLVSKDDG